MSTRTHKEAHYGKAAGVIHQPIKLCELFWHGNSRACAQYNHPSSRGKNVGLCAPSLLNLKVSGGFRLARWNRAVLFLLWRSPLFHLSPGGVLHTGMSTHCTTTTKSWNPLNHARSHSGCLHQAGQISDQISSVNWNSNVFGICLTKYVFLAFTETACLCFYPIAL